tara:strand:- start:9508 stop:10758 length:1251 start_codon:yes stop_codon:yes gene_type:complete
MRLNAAQHILLNKLDTKFMAYVGGFGSGKTFTGCLYLILFMARHPGTKVGYFGISYSSIRDIFYPTFEEAAKMLGFTCETMVANKEVHLYRNGKYYGTVICRSLDNPDKIVGYKVACALVDEIDTLPIKKAENAWRKVIARLRLIIKGVENKVIVTTTPEGFGFIYETFCKKPSPMYSMVQASTYENAEFLPEGYIDSLYETYPSELISAYINGDFVNLTSGTIYRSFNRKIHNSNEEVEGNEAIYVGMDFNIDKMAATIYVKRGKEWHAVDEISDAYDTEAVCNMLRERYPTNIITVYPDSSGKNRTTKSMGKVAESDISVIEKFRFRTKFRSVNPRVKDRIAAVNAAFEKGKVFVNVNKCPNTAECLEQQAYDDNGEPDKKSGKDHQNDATGYLIAYEMPLKKPIRSVKVNFNG